MAETFDGMMDFLEDEDGFTTPPLPSVAYPEGHQYSIPSPDALTGMKLNALGDIMLKKSKGIEIAESDIRRLRIDDEEERAFMEQVLTPEAVEEMLADGVKWTHLQRLTTYGFTFFAVSEEAANDMVERGLFKGKMEPAATNREQRRAQSKTTRTTRATAGSSASRTAQRKA